jgi:hypothetical protein
MDIKKYVFFMQSSFLVPVVPCGSESKITTDVLLGQQRSERPCIRSACCCCQSTYRTNTVVDRSTNWSSRRGKRPGPQQLIQRRPATGRADRYQVATIAMRRHFQPLTQHAERHDCSQELRTPIIPSAEHSQGHGADSLTVDAAQRVAQRLHIQGHLHLFCARVE